MSDPEATQQLPLHKIKPSRFQLRTYFDPEYIKGLAQSIETTGLQQPIKVRPVDEGYELVHGECRLKAFKMLGRETIRATVEDMTDQQQLAQGLTENLQREDIDALSEANGINLMHTKQQQTIPAIAKSLGKSETYVNNRLSLLRLPPRIQEMVLRGLLKPTAALHCLHCKEPQDVNLVADQALKFKLTAEGVGGLVESLNRLHDTPDTPPEAKQELISHPDVTFPCGSCERKFAKHQLTQFTLCGECSNELWAEVLKIRQRRQRQQAEKQTLAPQPSQHSTETPGPITT